MARVTNHILVIDVEATCWDSEPPLGENGRPMEAEIIEIGVCDLSRDNPRNEWVIVGSESILVRPVRSTISPFCTQLTTLTQAEVDKGIDFHDACHYLINVYDSLHRPWASWGDYDRILFERQCRSPHPKFRKQSWSRYPFSDTHWNMKNFYSLLTRMDKEIGMAEALKREGLSLLGTHHRGVDDAVNTARILQKRLP